MPRSNQGKRCPSCRKRAYFALDFAFNGPDGAELEYAEPAARVWPAPAVSSRAMAIKLHRCPVTFAKAKGHPCWKVQSALDEAGVDYEVVKEPLFRWNRKEYKKATGVNVLPALEFEDGTFLREESDDLVARIKEGRLPIGSG
jgi:hypothetical protein